MCCPGGSRGGDCLSGLVKMAELDVARLLQNPLGELAPPGARGDIVRVSDGRANVYLDPEDFERASEDDLRAQLVAARREARAARDARVRNGQAAPVSRVASRSFAPSVAEHPLSAPRRTGALAPLDG